MKLIIDIPEELYKAVSIIDVKYEDTVQIPLEVIANGIPLEDIKAEIDKYKKSVDKAISEDELKR